MMDLPFSYSTVKTGLVLVVTTSEPHLCFLVDTGSTHNLLFSYVLDNIEGFKYIQPENSVIIAGLNGKNMAAGKSIRMKLIFENNTAESDFIIVAVPDAIVNIQNESGVQIHGILGVDFLTKNKWIIDFKNSIILK